MGMTKASAVIIARGTSNAAFTQLTGGTGTRSGATANFNKTSHGRSTGDKMLIQGSSIEEFNGLFSITVVDANNFTYPMKADPGANPASASLTADLVTLGTPLDVSTCYGGIIIGGIQNGSAPGVQAELWMGQAVTGSADGDYVWRSMLGGGVLANAWTPFSYTIKQGDGLINFAVLRNTTNAVDCFILANTITAAA